MSLITEMGGYARNAARHPKVQRAAWVVAGLLAADLVLLAFFWGPAAMRHHQLKEGIAGYLQAKSAAQDAQAAAENYGQLARRVKNLEAKWESPTNQPGLIQSLTRLAARCGLRIVSQDFDMVDSKGGGKAFKQNLSLAGTYGALRRFFVELENIPSLTVVEQARLERAGEQGDQVRAVLQLCTYVQSPRKGP